MKPEHQDLFVDLLVEKINNLKLAIEKMKICCYHSKNSDIPISSPQQVQELINKYEARIEELTAICDKETKRANTAERKLSNSTSLTVEDLDTIKKLKKDITKLTKERDNALEGKEDRRAMAAAITQYKIKVAYAESQGFKFLKLDKMKQAIEASNSQESEKPASISEEPADEPQSVIPTTIPPVKAPIKIDFEGHTDCPNGMHNQRGNTIEVASYDCKRCPFCQSINYDEKYVECSLKQ